MRRTNAPFHVPAPVARPGETPDFSHLKFPEPGAHKRPSPDVNATETMELAFGLIRVLDDDHKAVGEWDPKLDAETLRTGLKHMLMTRAYDDRLLKMQRTKRLSFYMKSLGEEAVAVAAAMALRFEDMVFPSYRQQGILFTRGRDMVDMMCHCISNARDNLKGRQLPVHYTWREGNFFSISGNLTTQFPQAVGWGMAEAYKGSDNIAASWIGDGSTAEGDFHSALTLAGVYKAPVVLNVVNNQWAISMTQSLSGGERTTFASKAIGYAMPGLRVDGNDFLAVYAATQWAAERARAGHGATLLEIYTYRAEAHSTSDDPSKYRPKEEWNDWPLGDPVERLKNHLIALGEWSQDQHDAYWDECVEKVAAAWKESVGHGTLEEGPLSPTQTIFEDVYEQPDWRQRRQRQDLGV